MAIFLILCLALGLGLSWPQAAPAAPVAELQLLTEAVRNLKQENYEEALEQLTRAWQRGPQTPETAFYLGQVHRRLLRYQEARKYLEEAVRLKPRYPEAQLLLADTLIALDEPGRAEPLLKALKGMGYEPGPTAYLLGMAAYKQKRYGEAVDHFRQAQADPKVAQEAKVQESMALAALRRFPEARKSVQEAVALNPLSPAASFAQGYAGALEAVSREAKRFRFSAAAGFDYDSNVTLQPDSAGAAQQVSGRGDAVYTQTATLEYNLVPRGPWALWASYNYYQNFHFRLTKFDVWSNTLGLAPSYTWSNSRLIVPFQFNYTDVESDKYSTAFSLTPTYFHLITPKWGLEVVLRLARFYYWFPVALGEDDRSGRDLGGSLACYYFLKNQEGYIQARFSYDRLFTQGSNWSNSLYRLSFTTQYPLAAWLKVRWFLDLAIQPYVNPFFNGNPFVTNPRREDKILVCGAEAIIPLYRGLELNLHYYYVRNNSNIPLYDYNRHIGGGMLGYRY